MSAPDIFFQPPNGNAPQSGWGVQEIVAELRRVRESWRVAQRRNNEFSVREFPSRQALKSITESLCAVLFPMRLGPPDLRQEGEDYFVGHTLDLALNALSQQAALELAYSRRFGFAPLGEVSQQAAILIKAFARQLPALRQVLDQDVEAAYLGDPAARSVDEVLLCYPGILAVIHYRLAHALHALGLPLIARIVSEIAHSVTGIDIHPGARIGAGFFIDHGTGVVIGETAIIGNRVRLYQAVTLGARSFSRDENGGLKKGAPRHPILEDDVVVYAGATILGRITIGKGSSIGGNVWLTQSVPPGSQITQAGVQHSERADMAAT